MDDPDVHDSESVLGIDGVPESILVIGGGALGCEYASIFAALGVQVTIVDGCSHLARALDVEMARVLSESFNGQFVMHEGSTIDRFIDATFAVPTRSEAYKYAAYDGLMRLDRRAGLRAAA